MLASILLTGGCMEAADVGRGPECRSELDAAMARLERAKARGLQESAAYVQAASLLSAAKVQQQFSEYQNCVVKARQADAYLDQLDAQ